MGEERNEVEELKNEIEALKTKNRDLITQLRKKTDITSEEAAKLAAELDEVKAEKVKLEAALKKANESIASLQKEAQEKLTSKSSALQRLIREEGLVKALTSEKVKPEFLPAVVALLREKVMVDEEKLEAYVTENGTRKTLDEFVKAWAASNEGKNFIGATPSIGGGALGAGYDGGTGKAWKDMSLDEKSTLWRTQPDLAKRLQAGS